MATPRSVLDRRLSLVDAVDHLLNRGVVLTGRATLSLADVELVYLGINVVLASVETLRQGHAPAELADSRPGGSDEIVRPLPLAVPPPSPAASVAAPPVPPRTPSHLGPRAGPPVALPEGARAAPGESPERGLARLVLALVELLRQVVERQAIRRSEGGDLSDDQVERMGIALMELEAKMAELREAFGLAEEDLNLDLGPLGRLL